MAKASTLLKKLAARGQYGWPRTPKTYLMPTDVDGSYCAYYHEALFDMTFDEWKLAARLSNRYRRFVNYVTEIKPQWTKITETRWADNSVSETQRSLDGSTREIMVKYPSGDACY